MSPAKLHSLHAPTAPAPSSSTASPDTSNARNPSSQFSDLHDGTNDYVDDTRPTTAQSYRPMDDSAGVQRSASRASTSAADAGFSRNNTLKKKSLGRKASLKRSGSRKSLSAGNIKGVSFADGSDPRQSDYNSALNTPIPTQGAPTDILANRFQAWRAFLKTLITYFREVQTSYETRSKAIMKVCNVVTNAQMPTAFMSEGGIADANRILSDYHKQALSEANKAREVEYDVIQALNGLRADLGSKIKEIKGLHGDFKNSVDKELDGTKRAVHAYQESLQHYENEDGFDKGRSDPFLVRLNVDRMVERQIDEENYLHRAYLNLESSGRELESIVVGEIQKAYNALAGILKREADEAYNTVDLLRTGPIAVPKDLDWATFVNTDPHLVNPELPVRRLQDIHYPNIDHPAAAEIRSGMLERKSKYLKSYTPGWYVLSPTHIHEFKSADNIYSQPPVMSLYLGDQKLGSHSGPESGSHKFMLKGRQTGSSMHRGHSWVFRAESHETMLEWFEAIKSLTEKTGAEKTAYVRKHARSVSGNSARAMSIASSDGLEEDEADGVPYAASIDNQQVTSLEQRPPRPQPGGRFPSDLAIPRTLAAAGVAGSEYSSDAEAEHHVGPSTPGQEANPYVLTGIASTAGSPSKVRDQAPQEYEQDPYALPLHPAPPAQAAYAQPAHSAYPPPQMYQAPAHMPPPATHYNPSAADEFLAAGTAAALGGGAVAALHQNEEPTLNEPVVAEPATFAASEAPEAADTFKPVPVRHYTDVSVSALHVPGEFPKSAGLKSPAQVEEGTAGQGLLG